ncbi:hypothetical protein KVV02_001677 [Mortierella alpina]|uniref:Uncharacterized protein n=1 Tax=Mortierella alpina TaxID=64518 RepID=A0A9P8A6V6_MORAP|nr:hypothetical protein KVV02_001677 [Mortierella alpina]
MATTHKKQSKIMSIFKMFTKNKTASVASTPTHTPRASLQSPRAIHRAKMTPEEALDKLSQTLLPNAASGPFIR